MPPPDLVPFTDDPNGPRALARTLGAVEVEEAVLPAGWEMHGHGHAATHLCLVLEGGFEERLSRGSEWCAAGTLRVSPAGDRHDLRFGGAGARVLLVVAPADDALPRPTRRGFLRDPWLAERARELRAALHDPDDLSPLSAGTLLREILAQSVRARRPGDAGPAPWLLRVRDLLHDRAGAPPSLDEVAAEAGVHPVYLARAFRRHFGCAPGEYVRRVRLEAARRLLVASDRSLSRVALDCGFADQAHMTRQLRRALGVTPAALRASA